MEVSLQQKNKTYYAVFRVRGEDGKLKQKWVSTKIKADGRHKKEAMKKAREIAESYSETNYRKILFVDWIQEWLNNKEHQIQVTTMESYRSMVKNHIDPYFRSLNVYLNELTPQQIQNYYNTKAKEIGPRGKPISGKTIHRQHIVIRGSLEDAVKKNIILFNPADRVDVPKREKFVGCFYNAEQTSQLLDAVKGTLIEGIVTVTVYYGLRKGEALGLKWNAIDFDNNTFEIRHTVVHYNVTVEKDQTKNSESNSSFPLLPEIKEMLLQIKAVQDSNRQRLGNTYIDSGYVFTMPNGKRLNASTLWYHFQKVLETNDLPHIRFHDLRHTTASLLLAKGCNVKKIQEWLRHSNISTTLNIYAHLDYTSKSDTAASISEILKR